VRIKEAEPLRKLDASIPRDLECVCLKAMRKEKERRYQSATEMAEDLRRFLGPYDWAIVLGSVHWVGSWGIDSAHSKQDVAEWGRRDIDGVFDDYAGLLRDLASAGLCDVLAHPDRPKLFGHRPTSFTPLHSAIVEAAQSGGCAVEINSNGYNRVVAEPYPALPVLEQARAAGLSITLAARAGYGEFVSYRERRAVSHPLPVRAD
jgi:histidinol-phosphatase (PHP family)